MDAVIVIYARELLPLFNAVASKAFTAKEAYKSLSKYTSGRSQLKIIDSVS